MTLITPAEEIIQAALADREAAGREPNFAEVFARHVRDRRHELGLSLEELGERIGWNAVRIGSYERMDRRPAIEVADELLQVAFRERLAIVALDQPAAPPPPTPQEMAAAMRQYADLLDPEGRR